MRPLRRANRQKDIYHDPVKISIDGQRTSTGRQYHAPLLFVLLILTAVFDCASELSDLHVFALVFQVWVDVSLSNRTMYPRKCTASASWKRLPAISSSGVFNCKNDPGTVSLMGAEKEEWSSYFVLVYLLLGYSEIKAAISEQEDIALVREKTSSAVISFHSIIYPLTECMQCKSCRLFAYLHNSSRVGCCGQ